MLGFLIVIPLPYLLADQPVQSEENKMKSHRFPRLSVLLGAFSVSLLVLSPNAASAQNWNGQGGDSFWTTDAN